MAWHRFGQTSLVRTSRRLKAEVVTGTPMAKAAPGRRTLKELNRQFAAPKGLRVTLPAVTLFVFVRYRWRRRLTPKAPSCCCAPVAQRLEQQTHNLLVRGSNPCGGTNRIMDLRVASLPAHSVRAYSVPRSFRARLWPLFACRAGRDL